MQFINTLHPKLVSSTPLTMKKHLPALCFLLLIIAGCYAQPGTRFSTTEFGTSNNGLMYNEKTISALRHMVDSLNLRFKSCPAHPTYFSRPQATVWRVAFKSAKTDFRDMRRDMDAHMNFAAITQKYAQYIYTIDTVLTAVQITNAGDDSDKERVSYLLGSPQKGYEYDDAMSGPRTSIAGKWRYYYSPKDRYDSFYRMECCFLPNDFVQQKIPDEYASYIAYVDCMIDTSTVVCLADRKSGSLFEDKVLTPDMDALNDYLNRKMNVRPLKKDDNYEYKYITDIKSNYAIAHLKADRQFISLLEAAANECTENNGGAGMISAMVKNCLSARKALELKRHQIVVGNCSQDQSPRIHAREIAILAAETNSWDIFLRAHLDIMNDRFERRSDGSYAYGRRQTYLKELEVLNLDIVDLMLGLSLRADNTAVHHYNGTIWRLGRALSESSHAVLFETKALQIMKDNRLDDFNRGLISMLYTIYLKYLPDVKMANEKINLLKKEVNDFPPFIASYINELKERTKTDDNDL